MPTLNLVLNPEAVGRVHDVLICLGKFSESVSVEARRDKLVFSALNSSKSAYACFTFDSGKFCSRYHFAPNQVRSVRSSDGDGGRFTCRIYNRALLSVFKGRLLDARDKDTAVERCELSIQDRPDVAECRLLIKMICRHGVLKTYKLTYESTEVMHAVFDSTAAPNRWSISSKLLKDFVEHFGPKTEQLDIYSENGRATFTSYTEKIMDGKEVLKQPLQTSVAIDTQEFEEFTVEEKLHIAISVKDFKAIVAHGDSLNANVTALYSRPTRPMQIAYEGDGMLCDFTLMTIGDFRGSSATPAPVTSATSKQPVAQRPDAGRSRVNADVMAPPEKPAERSFRQDAASQRQQRPSPPPPKASLDNQSLFFPDGDEDRRWDEDESGDEDQDVLGWDPSADNDTKTMSFKWNDLETGSRTRPHGDTTSNTATEQRLAPTQKISEIRGLFDD